MFYEKKVETDYSIETHKFQGKRGTKPEFIFRNNGINQFSVKEEQVPEGYTEIEPPSLGWIRERMSDPDRTRVVPLKNKPEGDLYFTHDNGGRPFAVYITKTQAQVYTVDNKNHFTWSEDWDVKDKWTLYTKCVGTFKIRNAFIGESDPIKNHHPAGDWGKGNSILLELDNDISHTYVMIGFCVYQFETRERIHTLHSPVGNNDVPYPVAESENNYFFTLSESWCSKNDFNLKTPDDIYYDYYNNNERCKSNPMSNVTYIHERKY